MPQTKEQLQAIARARARARAAASKPQETTREFQGPLEERPFVGPVEEKPAPQNGALRRAQFTKDMLTGLVDLGISGMREAVNKPSLVASSFTAGAIGAVNPNDTFREAYARQKASGQAEIDSDEALVHSGRLRTPHGELIANTIAGVPGVKQIGTAIDWAGDRIEDYAGPEVRDLAEAAATLLTLGHYKGPLKPGAITPKMVADLGIDIKAPGTEIAQQLRDRVSQMPAPVRGEALSRLQDSLRRAEVTERGAVSQLYEQAGQMPGGRMKIPPNSAMQAAVHDLNEKWNILDNTGRPFKPYAARRLRELDTWIDKPGNTRIRISEVDRYRQRIERDRVRTRDPDEKLALQDLLATVDKWETDNFTRVVAGGNRPAYQAYLRARGARENYNQRFTQDKVINNLLSQNNLTAMEVRKFIWGESSVVGTAHAAETVRRMKEIFGADSPEITALRQDMLFDIVKPLVSTRATGSTIREFIDNYENTISGNPELVRELAPFSATQLDTAYRVAKSLDNQGLADSVLAKRFDPLKIAVRLLFRDTQPLAHGSAKLNIIDSVVRGAANVVTPNSNKLYRDLFGRSPDRPILSGTGRAALAGTLIYGQDDEEK